LLAACRFRGRITGYFSVSGRAFLAQSVPKSNQHEQHVYHRKHDHLFPLLNSPDWIMKAVKIE